MYKVKGYVFYEQLGRVSVSTEPHESVNDYDGGHTFMKTSIEIIDKMISQTVFENPPKCTGYMFTLISEEEVK